MRFRTQDKSFIEELRKNIISISNNPKAWRYIYNHIYITDMLDYLRSISLDPITSGSGNYTPTTAIVIDNNDMIYDLKNKIRSSGIDPEDLWITPLVKSNSISEDMLIRYLGIELKRLNPNNVLIYCPDNVSLKDNIIDCLRNKKLLCTVDCTILTQEDLIQTLLSYCKAS